MSNIAKELVNWHLVSKVEAYYNHGMSWDIDAICKDFDLDKTKHIKSLFVGKWGKLHIELNDEGLQAIKDNVTNAEYEEILESKILAVSGSEWTDGPTSAKYFDEDYEEYYEEEY